MLSEHGYKLLLENFQSNITRDKNELEKHKDNPLIKSFYEGMIVATQYFYNLTKILI